MGLLKAGIGALTSVLSDQWRDYFYCDSMPEDVLVTKGVKRVNSAKSSNTKGSDNVISNGSIIAVNEGQCMMIVDNGAVSEFCAEAGEFVWDSSTEPSIFYGGFGNGLKKSWEALKRRFTFGGDTARDQRVYFFNTKEIIGNKYGTANPVPFRVTDPNINLNLDVNIKCFGDYSYKITDPMLFYKNVCGNITSDYKRDKLDSQLKSEFLTALQPGLYRISAAGVAYYELPGKTTELANAMNAELSEKWANLRGISVVNVGVSSVKANEEDEKTIKELQKAAALQNSGMTSTWYTTQVGNAMNTAAANTSGAMMGFAGMNFAGAAGANYAGVAQAAQQPVRTAQPAPAPAADGWDCACGAKGNTGKFCAECGAPKPAPAAGWTCSCGAVNKGKFCSECGAKKPEGAPLYRCDKCGWEPEDPKNPPKFCPECGDPFNDGDIIK